MKTVKVMDQNVNLLSGAILDLPPFRNVKRMEFNEASKLSFVTPFCTKAHSC
jgi:hypothetical protein